MKKITILILALIVITFTISCEKTVFNKTSLKLEIDGVNHKFMNKSITSYGFPNSIKVNAWMPEVQLKINIVDVKELKAQDYMLYNTNNRDSTHIVVTILNDNLTEVSFYPINGYITITQLTKTHVKGNFECDIKNYLGNIHHIKSKFDIDLIYF